MIQRMSIYSNIALRLLLGFIFVMHGKFKLEWGYANLAGWLQTQGFPMAASISYVLPWIEVIGGVLVILGLYARYLAALFSLILLFALFGVKLSSGFISSSATGYEFDLLLLLVSIHVAVITKNSFQEAWSNLRKGGERSHVQNNHHQI